MGRHVATSGLMYKHNEKSSDEPDSKLFAQLQILVKDGARTPLVSSQDPGLPPWFDFDKFSKGQRYFNNNFYAMFVSKLCGLLAILLIPSILQVLVLTNQSTKPVTAFKRYMATITHMLRWYDGDLLEPTSSAHKSLMAVRSRHCSASMRASQHKLGHISQLDMVLTQFGFMGFALTAPRKLGLTGTTDEVEGFVHFWRTIGYLIGIEDRFNLCRENAAETRLHCKNVLEQIFVPALQNPPKEFSVMGHALIDGMWTMIPFLDFNSYMNFIKFLAGMKMDVYKSDNNDNNNIKKSDIHESLSSQIADYYSHLLLQLQIFVHTVALRNPWLSWFVRPFLNVQTWLTILLTQRYPLMAFAVFGRTEVESPMTYH